MDMYNYAFLYDNGVCHSIYQSSDERTDLVEGFVTIDTYDEKYLYARWTGSEWDYPPSIQHTWNGSEWVLEESTLTEGTASEEDRELFAKIARETNPEVTASGVDVESPEGQEIMLREVMRKFQEASGREFVD